jgi:sarcosine oxidase
MRRSFDVSVVGLGAAGSSVLYQLARRGADVVGFDRFVPPHSHGSSHGQTRITRQAIGEGEVYVPLVLRSNAIWEELEASTGERLLERCGFIYITRDDAGTSHHGKKAFLERTRRAAERFDIAHEILDAVAIRSRFPQFTGFVGDERAYFERGGGFLRPELCVATQIAQARALGAHTMLDCNVARIDRYGVDVRLSTATDVFRARSLVLAMGSWLPRHVPGKVARRITVQRQVLHWFDVLDAAAYEKGATPVFIWTHGLGDRDQFYGFPPCEGKVKVARENYAGASIRMAPAIPIRSMVWRWQSIMSAVAWRASRPGRRSRRSVTMRSRTTATSSSIATRRTRASGSCRPAPVTASSMRQQSARPSPNPSSKSP